jgi:hypothetical protein
MSFIHYIYVGDFELIDGLSLRFARTLEDPRPKVVVRRPLDLRVAERLVSECSGPGESGVIPESWSIWPEGVEEIRFLRRLKEETGCRLFEWSHEVSIDHLTPRRGVAKAD